VDDGAARADRLGRDDLNLRRRPMTDREEQLGVDLAASRLVTPPTHRLVDVLSTDVPSSDFDLNAVYTKCLVFNDRVVSQAIAARGRSFLQSLRVNEVMEMLRRHSRRRADKDRYLRLADLVEQARTASLLAAEHLDDAVRSGAPLSEVRAAYEATGKATQEPLPAQPALDRHRPVALGRELSTLRTHRQWHLMSDPPGVRAPHVVRPNSRAPLGPHVAGLEAEFAERQWGVDLLSALDDVR
jgi:hypothetical protein